MDGHTWVKLEGTDRGILQVIMKRWASFPTHQQILAKFTGFGFRHINTSSINARRGKHIYG